MNSQSPPSPAPPDSGNRTLVLVLVAVGVNGAGAGAMGDGELGEIGDTIIATRVAVNGMRVAVCVGVGVLDTGTPDKLMGCCQSATHKPTAMAKAITTKTIQRRVFISEWSA